MRGMQDIVITLASFSQTYLPDIGAQIFPVKRATNLLGVLEGKCNRAGRADHKETKGPKYWRREEMSNNDLYIGLTKY